MPASHWAIWYWPIWLFVFVGAFLGPEVYALVSGKPQNTLSWWVWRMLKVSTGERVSQWTAADFLTFGIWMTLFVWLTFHFFLRRFT
jgi:hypothetical protein